MNTVKDPRRLTISEYDYPLPGERIAQFPLEQRDASKLLICRDGKLSQDSFINIAKLLPPESLLVFNETRVIHARLIFHKSSGSRIEVFCLEPVDPADIQQAFQKKECCTWKCLVGNSKRWKDETLLLEAKAEGVDIQFTAQRIEKLEDASHIQFSWAPGHLTFAQVLEAIGLIPLPPYIDREAIDLDQIRYQTVYARNNGSVAAPTAGLHFTDQVLETLTSKGIETARITLHVGAGTFKPVSSEVLSDHQMHSEQVIIPAEVIRKLMDFQERSIVLVGTTSVRAIESIYWQGLKWMNAIPGDPTMNVQQWDPYDDNLDQRIINKVALERVLEVLSYHNRNYLQGTTSLMIAPGYRYRFPSAIITNFHQPKSTLLLLVSAFVGDVWRTAYDYALQNDFRFLSYGDSCLFFKR